MNSYCSNSKKFSQEWDYEEKGKPERRTRNWS